MGTDWFVEKVTLQFGVRDDLQGSLEQVISAQGGQTCAAQDSFAGPRLRNGPVFRPAFTVNAILLYASIG